MEETEGGCVSLLLMEMCKQGGPSRDFCWASLVNVFIDNLEEEVHNEVLEGAGLSSFGQ